MKRLLIAALVFILLAGGVSPASAVILPSLGIPLTCNNSGTHQDIVKNPIITNNTNKVIPTNKTIFWKSSDRDSGRKTLSEPLAIGSSVITQGERPGNNYNCTAHYNP